MEQEFLTHKDRIEYEKDQAFRRRWFIFALPVYVLMFGAAWYFGAWLVKRFF